MADRPAGPAQAQRRPLTFLLIAHYLSSFGNSVTVVTVPLYVLSRGGSATAVGWAGFASALPLVFAGAVGGVWVDRIGGRWMSVLSDTVAGVIIGLVPLLTDTVGLPQSALLLLLFGRSLVATPVNAARLGLLAPLVERAQVRLESANSWFQGGMQLGLLVGAPLAGVVFVAYGATTGLYVDCATFFASAILITVGVPGGLSANAPRRAGFFKQLAEGPAAVRQIPVVGAMTLFLFVTNFLGDSFTPVLLPLYAKLTLGGGQYLGWMLAAAGAGATIGTFAYGPVSKWFLRSRRWTLLGCFAVIGVLRLSMAADPGPVLATVISFMVGLCIGPLNPVLATVMFRWVPEQLRGRVFTLTQAVSISAAPAGVLVAAWSVTLFGLRETLAGFGAAYLVLILLSTGRRALDDMDRLPEPAPVEAADEATAEPEPVEGLVESAD